MKLKHVYLLLIYLILVREMKSQSCPTVGSISHYVSGAGTAGCDIIDFSVVIGGLSGVSSCPSSGITGYWNFGDGTPTASVCVSPSSTVTTSHTFTLQGKYKVYFSLKGPALCDTTKTSVLTTTCTQSDPLPCEDCIPSFAPIPGKKYVLSAWVKEDSPAQSITTYTNPSISVIFPHTSTTIGPFVASGAIIDGWQRVEKEFLVPPGETNMNVQFNCISGDCYYDDVRVFPFDGSMKSYVYDPKTLKLVAELDERNYATLYEYDEEGKLIRVKKETEKGKMTIKENRNNTKK